MSANRTIAVTRSEAGFPGPPSPSATSGLNVPGYSITRRIGQGGQAVVYEAVQHSLGRRVALKVLDPVFAGHADLTRRFLDEGRILANLGHSNVLTIHDVGVAGGLHYIAMELIEGGNLRRRIRAGIAPPVVLDYLRVIADCLACAHAQNVVHRDIKPGNVLFRRDGTLLLADFGIAKRLDGGELTVAGTTLGTPGYLSPEQVECRSLDGRADIYSLGAMAFEMFTGRRPYLGDSDFDTMRMHIEAPLPVLPPALSRYQPMIERMMAKRPEDRFENAQALLEVLDAFRSQPVEADVVRTPAPGDGAPPGERDGEDDATGALANDATRINPAIPGPAPARTTLSRWRSRSGNLLAVAALLGGALSALPLKHLVNTAAVEAPADAPWPVAGATPTGASVEARAVAAGVDRRVEALLAQARVALEDLRLTTPEEDNALDRYRQVLAIDPGNAEALAGRDAIAARYLSLAQAAAGRGETRRAGVLVDRGLIAKPDAAGLLALRTDLEARARRERDAARLAAAIPATPRDDDAPHAGNEIQGESPAELLRRVKGWFH